MKFDDKTLQILKAFSLINPSIKFVKGNILKTVNPTRTILAKATITSEIEGDFCIDDLNRFMSTLSLFEDPEISLEQSQCIISDGKDAVSYTYGSELGIKLPPEKDIVLPSKDVQFSLTNTMLQQLKKALAILSLREVAIVGKDGKLFVNAFDNAEITKDKYSIEIGNTKKTFQAIFRAENLKLLPLDYDVTISSKGISHFSNPDVEFWIAVEKDSVFE